MFMEPAAPLYDLTQHLDCSAQDTEQGKATYKHACAGASAIRSIFSQIPKNPVLARDEQHSRALRLTHMFRHLLVY
jgi:hypothetical protein